jgi:hypothetical protein
VITPPTDPALDQLRSAATLQEYRFRSQVPLIGSLIARFRELWNSMSTKWYVRPLIEQQSEINRQFVAALMAQAADLRDVTLRFGEDEERMAEWLIQQDREQSTAIGDLSETALRLVQTNRRLAELEHRLAMLESRPAPPIDEQKP